MAANAQFMESFLQRFQQLEAHKDLSNSLIRDVLTYCNQLEQENAQLLQVQSEEKLELDEARRSRRELQKELRSARNIIERYDIDYSIIAVGQIADSRSLHPADTVAEQ
jgi:multidrug resistance efflux pump